MTENEQGENRAAEDAGFNPLNAEAGQPDLAAQGTSPVVQALVSPATAVAGIAAAKDTVENIQKVVATLNEARSCLLTFANNTMHELRLVRSDHAHGGFSVSPPGLIKPATTITFGSQSKAWSIATGTEGSVTYMGDGMEVTLRWNNPFLGDNSGGMTLEGPNRNKFTTIHTVGVGNEKAPMGYDLFAIEMKGFDVFGAILDKWAETNWGAGPLGFPTSDELPAFDGIGRYRNFERGIISWHPETGAHIVTGDIALRWLQVGREAFGYPLTDEMKTPDWRGRYNHFRQVHLPGQPETSIYWTEETRAACEVYGAIRARWAELGWELSSLGYPLSGEEDYNGGRVQRFQGGALWWTPENGVVEIGMPPPAEPPSL